MLFYDGLWKDEQIAYNGPWCSSRLLRLWSLYGFKCQRPTSRVWWFWLQQNCCLEYDEQELFPWNVLRRDCRLKMAFNAFDIGNYFVILRLQPKYAANERKENCTRVPWNWRLYKHGTRFIADKYEALQRNLTHYEIYHYYIDGHGVYYPFTLWHHNRIRGRITPQRSCSCWSCSLRRGTSSRRE